MVQFKGTFSLVSQKSKTAGPFLGCDLPNSQLVFTIRVVVLYIYCIHWVSKTTREYNDSLRVKKYGLSLAA